MSDDATQLGMFGHVPYVKHSDTSHAAANNLGESTLRQLRRRVWQCLRDRGDMTDQEIQIQLGMAGNTERPRRIELQERGLVVDSGMRRRTQSGLLAVVWHALELPRSDARAPL